MSFNISKYVECERNTIGYIKEVVLTQNKHKFHWMLLDLQDPSKGFVEKIYDYNAPNTKGWEYTKLIYDRLYDIFGDESVINKLMVVKICKNPDVNISNIEPRYFSKIEV